MEYEMSRTHGQANKNIKLNDYDVYTDISIAVSKTF